MKQTETKQTMNMSEGRREENQDKEFLRTEPLGKLLVRLALPTVAAQLINMLYNIVDRIYIGHIPEVGAAALTGVGVCMPLIMIVSAFAALVGYGGAPRASIFMGKKDKEAAEKTLGNCFSLQLIISVVLTAVLLLFNRDFLMAFGASENTIAYGVSYMNINALGKARESIAVAVTRKFILLIPLIYIMPQVLQSDKTMAVYLAEPAADTLAVTFTAILFAVQFKKILAEEKKTRTS